MARTGRPPIFPTVADFEACNPDGFFKWADEEAHIYSWEWFAVYMNCSTDALKAYMAKDGIDELGNYDEQQDFQVPLKRIGTKIMAYLTENGLLGKYRDAVTIFYMKNYGYTDKQEVETNMTVSVQLADNFKGLAN